MPRARLAAPGVTRGVVTAGAQADAMTASSRTSADRRCMLTGTVYDESCTLGSDSRSLEMSNRGLSVNPIRV